MQVVTLNYPILVDIYSSGRVREQKSAAPFGFQQSGFAELIRATLDRAFALHEQLRSTF